jgi:hypothetical protein
VDVERVTVSDIFQASRKLLALDVLPGCLILEGLI